VVGVTMADFSGTDDRVVWQEVTDEEEESEVESGKRTETERERAPLLLSDRSDFSLSVSSGISRGGPPRLLSKNPMGGISYAPYLFASIPMWLSMINVGVLIFSLVGDLKESNKESSWCIYPLSYYLRAAAIHAGINVVLFGMYFYRLAEKIFSNNNNSPSLPIHFPLPTLPSSVSPSVLKSVDKPNILSPLLLGDGWYDYLLERSIGVMFIIQIILGFAGEIYIGGLSVGPAWLSSCLHQSPVMYSYSVGVSLYENAFVLVLLVFGLRKMFGCSL